MEKIHNQGNKSPPKRILKPEETTLKQGRDTQIKGKIRWLPDLLPATVKRQPSLSIDTMNGYTDLCEGSATAGSSAKT